MYPNYKKLLDELIDKYNSRLVFTKAVRETKYPSLEDFGFWKEIGGVWVIAPRQSGKTTAIRWFSEYLRITENAEILFVDHQTDMINTYRGINNSNTVLLVDNFIQTSNKLGYNELLNRNWKAVIGISSL